MTNKTGIAVNEVLKERDRQEFLKAEGRFQYTCADHALSIEDAAIVLGEEFGELCRAILELKRLVHDGKTSLNYEEREAQVRMEAIQLTAVGLAICERFVEE